jgi:hypothetical protein
VFYIIGLHLCGGVRWFGTAAKTIKQRSGFRAVYSFLLVVLAI